ncbi:MAG TPA: hypothetical protein VGT78_00270 [Rhizomicrobium sp.]|nr:hypothetical protein [Rhizomicrobium sp.]
MRYPIRAKVWHHRWHLIVSLTIFVVCVGAFWLTSVEDHQLNAASFFCRSVDDPNRTVHLSIQRDGAGAQEVLLESKGATKIFHLGDTQPDYFSASDLGLSGQSNSLYFNYRTGKAIETATVPKPAQQVLMDRCRMKITADVCLARMQKILKGAVFDHDDCVSASPAECERWDSQHSITSEIRLICARH